MFPFPIINIFFLFPKEMQVWNSDVSNGAESADNKGFKNRFLEIYLFRKRKSPTSIPARDGKLDSPHQILSKPPSILLTRFSVLEVLMTSYFYSVTILLFGGITALERGTSKKSNSGQMFLSGKGIVVDVQSHIREPKSEEERSSNRLQVKSTFFWSLPSYTYVIQKKMPSNQVEATTTGASRGNHRCAQTDASVSTYGSLSGHNEKLGRIKFFSEKVVFFSVP